MKFDLDTAWSEAVDTIKSNFGLLATIAGALLFIPWSIIGLAVPDGDIETIGAVTTNPSLEEVVARAITFLGEFWWLLVILLLVAGFAQLTMMAVLRRRSSPTVGDAMAEAGRKLPTYVAMSLIELTLYLILASALIYLPWSLGSTAAMAVGIIIFTPVFICLTVKFSLSAVAIAIEGETNPVQTLRRSWHLTAGNGWRLLGFYLLAGLAIGIVGAIAKWIVGIPLAFSSQSVQLFGTTLFASAVEAIASVVWAAVLVAVFAQLVRLRERDEA